MANPRYRRLSGPAFEATPERERAHETRKQRRRTAGPEPRSSGDRLPRGVIALTVVAAVVAGCLGGAAIAAVSKVAAGPVASAEGGSAGDESAVGSGDAQSGPPVITQLPAPQVAVAAPAPSCEVDAVAAALAAGDADAVITALGGADGFRKAVSDESPCVSLSDPASPWVVVNKTRPLDPLDYAPAVQLPATTKTTSGANLRADAAAALDALTAAAGAEGAGDMALMSGYRSYRTQVGTFDAQVRNLGNEDAEHLSARPGYSEHQLGLAADVVACTNGSCGTIYDFAGTTQSQWVNENAWRFGYIVRYIEGETAITGYDPESWHLRYIGRELAAAYHEGGYTTLEEFFGLPAAPDYLD